MALPAKPPYKHSVRLKGELVKFHPVQDGTKLSLHHGNEVYKIFVPSDIQKTEAIEPMVGGPIEVWARKDRKVGGWIARTEVVRGHTPV